MLAVSLVGCAGATEQPIGTAIYVPPTRLGGHGSVMFLPAARPSPAASDAAILQTVLARIGPRACVMPVLGSPPFADLRGRIAEADNPEARTRAGRAMIARATMGHWTDQDGSVDAGLSARLLEVVSLIVERDHRLPPASDGDRARGPRLPESWLAAGQSLGQRSGCRSVTVSEVVRHDTLAFVDVGIQYAPLAGSGERWALEETAGTWKVIATHALWVS